MSEPSGADRDGPAAASRAGRSNRSWIMLVLVVVIAGTSLLVVDRSDAPGVPTAVPEAREGEADFFMERAIVTQYRADGTLEYRLTSDDVRHFERDAITRLAQPRLTLHDPGRAPWQMRAATGTLRRPPVGAVEETVSLEDGVVLEQTRQDGEQIRLSTPALTVYPRRQYAETDHDVIIDSLFGRTTATGLEGDLQLGMLTFHSSETEPVHTVLDPEQFK